MPEQKEIIFPAEIMFKSVFRNSSYTLECIKTVLSESGISGSVSEKASGHGKFISYTVTAVFPSDELLNSVCNKISSLDGYMMMF